MRRPCGFCGRSRDIASVLVNPLQALHPNIGAPGDSDLARQCAQSAFRSQLLYGTGSKALREVCTERGIALIFDEVFVGFRIAPGGAQEYFGVRADMVNDGKTVAGGLPVGVLCGRHELMRRFRDDRPADICFARGTFKSPSLRDGRDARVLDPVGQRTMFARSIAASTNAGTGERNG